MDTSKKYLLRQIPSVDELINSETATSALNEFSKRIITEAARKIVKRLREDILMGKVNEFLLEDILSNLISETKHIDQGNLRRVINATGVVLHTNLGRALLTKRAQEALSSVASSYCNLELDLESGKRGSRYSHLEELLTQLTGAEEALVVNNNAAAVLLALNTVGQGKEVIVSRGQLVEIGGAFRVPDVMKQSNTCLVEVGTTNKTYLDDYRKAITENTGLLLKIHTSNYKIVGFTHETTLEELASLGKETNLPVMEDVGSGFLLSLKDYGIGDEPTVQNCVATGADIVTFSGDKLLGGPQAGIIVGKSKYISQMKKNPLTRALRIDKFTVAALQATLIDYLDSEAALYKIPTLRMLTYTDSDLTLKAQQLKAHIKNNLKDNVRIELSADYSQVGGGALPTIQLPTTVLKLSGPLSANLWGEKLRRGSPSLMVRINDDRVTIDPRTILEEQFDDVVLAITNSIN